MSAKLNRKAFERAQALVLEGKFVYDERDAWSDHRPSAADENEFIHMHGLGEYANWYLRINDAIGGETKLDDQPLELRPTWAVPTQGEFCIGT
jgi:hypothetical protein